MRTEKVNSWERWLIRKVNWVSMTDGQTDICKHYRQTTLLSCYHHWKMNTMITASRGAKYQWRSIDSCLASDKKTLGIKKFKLSWLWACPPAISYITTSIDQKWYVHSLCLTKIELLWKNQKMSFVVELLNRWPTHSVE